MAPDTAACAHGPDCRRLSCMYGCPCSKRTLEDQAGQVIWRASDVNEWCGNPARPYMTAGGQQREDGWCEDCITKVCRWCRHD